MNRNRDHALMVTARFSWHQLDDALRKVDLRPVKAAAVAKAKSGVDANQKERVPLR